jgi:hypothetical protein
MRDDDREQCLGCIHFRNDPAYLETVITGLTSLGSGYGSVRADDGLCLRHDRYLSAQSWCADFALAGLDVETVADGKLS